MRARQQGTAAPAIVAAATPPTAAAVAAPPAETVPEQDPEAQDALDGATLVAGGVAGKKEGKKRKRKDGVEKAETSRDGTERHGESKKRRKKRKAE